MITVKNLQKYFNKNKQNQIHVIDNVSLDFPDTGLVCLLGPSGSGKTTLLNVLGGLDSVESGTFQINGNVLDRYLAAKWDSLRSRYFGYIFQNYILLPDLTVYQNLEFVLKMLNLDAKEINERINYALNAVGMIKYKKRFPNQLSGGQQQRIAIARALVKSPEVVIADEPTGNLDERNTTQIMNIIKKISKECLVILVTHERRLAEFYGDSIIELLDGKVISKNQSENTVDELYQTQDQNIYLQEYQKEVTENDDLSIQYFYKEKEPRKKLELEVIYQDNTFYIKSLQDNVKIRFLDSGSEIQIIDSKKPVLRKEEVEAFDYYLPKLSVPEKSIKSPLSLKDMVKMAFVHLGGLRKRRQRLVYLIFILSVIFVLISFINLFSVSVPEEKNFLNDNRNLVVVEGSQYDEEDLKAIEESGYRILFMPMGKYSYWSYQLQLNMFEQQKYQTTLINSSLFPIDLVKNPKLIAGSQPKAYNEAAVDKTLLDRLLEDPMRRPMGVNFYEQFLGGTIATDIPLKIVGIYDNGNPNIYVHQGTYNSVMRTEFSSNLQYVDETMIAVTNYYDYEEYLTDPRTATKIPFTGLKEGEVLISRDHSGNIENKFIFNNSQQEIIGIIDDASLTDIIMLSEETMKKTVNSAILMQKQGFSVYSENKEETVSYLRSLFPEDTVYDYYQDSRDREYAQTFDITFFVVSIIILVISSLFLYFIMRSSLISRVFEIGVYRALGVRKHHIYRIFMTEILVITLISLIIGLGLASAFILRVNSIMEVIPYPIYVPLFAAVFIILIHNAVGLLPILSLLRLTPSQILTKYDM